MSWFIKPEFWVDDKIEIKAAWFLVKLHLYKKRDGPTVYANPITVKVSKSQKQFFLKIHCPKKERNIISSFKKKCFWDLLTFNLPVTPTVMDPITKMEIAHSVGVWNHIEVTSLSSGGIS